MIAFLSLWGTTFGSLTFGAPEAPEMSAEERVRWILADYPTRRDALWDITDLDAILRVIRGELTAGGAPAGRVLPAAQMLGQIGWPLEVPALQAHIHHPDPAVRRAVIRSLGQTGEPSSIPLIVPFLADSDRTLRREAIIALGKFGEPGLIPQIRAAAGADPELVRLVEQARRRIEATREASPQTLVDALIETDEYEDLMAQYPAVRGVLEKMVADRRGSDRGRQHATRLLSLRRQRTAGPFFRLRLLPGNDVRDVRLEAIRGLGRTRYRSSVPQLISEAETTEDAELREAAVIALGEIGLAAAFDPLINLWRRSGLDLRVHLQQALRRICSSPGQTALMQLLGQRVRPSDSRVYVVDDNLELTSDVPRDTLYSLFESPNRVARRDAVLLLAVFGGPEVRSVLAERALADEDVEIRDLAFRAAEWLGGLFG